MSRQGAGGNGGERSRSRDGSGYDERRFAAALNIVTSASGMTGLQGGGGHCFEFLASQGMPVETAKKVRSLLQVEFQGTVRWCRSWVSLCGWGLASQLDQHGAR